jgi:hypothetical protein
MPSLQDTFLRLRSDCTVELLQADGFWPRLMAGELGDFHREYLVTTSTFSASWTNWERHPLGDEIVCLLSGHVTLVQETPGGEVQIEMDRPGQFAVNPRDTWHTANVHAESLLLFITASEGTEGRPR